MVADKSVQLTNPSIFPFSLDSSRYRNRLLLLQKNKNMHEAAVDIAIDYCCNKIHEGVHY